MPALDPKADIADLNLWALKKYRLVRLLSVRAHLIRRNGYMLKVLVFNDQKTPTAFVVSVLEEIFGQSEAEAQMIALHAEQNGDSICGIYRQDAEAEHLVQKATTLSRLHGFPLLFLIRPFPIWERTGVWVFGMVMKVVPEYRVSFAREIPPPS